MWCFGKCYTDQTDQDIFKTTNNIVFINEPKLQSFSKNTQYKINLKSWETDNFPLQNRLEDKEFKILI